MILVIGATGNIGSEVVRLLVAKGQAVRALSRDAVKAKAMLPAGVEIAQGDLTQPGSLAPALKGVEKLFFMSEAGPELANLAGAVFAAAQAAGVRHVVAVSSGTIAFEPPVAIGRWHLALEEKLKSTRLAWTMLRPGGFASNALRWAPMMIKSQGSVYAPHATGRMAPIDPRDIAAVAAVALSGPGHEGKTYVLTGSEILTSQQQAEAIGAALGKPIKFVEVPEEGARAGMAKSGMPPVMVDAIMELIRMGSRSEGFVNTTVQDLTGRPARTFAEWAKDHRAAFS